MEKIKITIADDHSLFINGLQLLMQHEPWIEIIEMANDGKELLDTLAVKQPDIVLLDINMPRMNGLNAIRYIKQGFPRVKIIILSTYNDDHLINKAKDLGVDGYLLKNSNKDEFFQVIRLIAAGHQCFPKPLPRQARDFAGDDNFLKHSVLTKREMEILRLIRDNLTNQQIATRLSLSIYTVETHRKNIMQKLGLNGPSALMKFIVENNI
jgi:two-component system nitrate/nitrite response regulator NarL